ncbi:hypothetical protein CBA19CS22_17845 [Caballeronia novacaledonica]|uniref:Uncharacterized protein n=1 Tax=Caballeronia novacaledonica TaxID=1544861 RepID=A0ACB5QTX5_9BURK|nr:hypothetical protein CBA19CS22_17845 [Caballeronia novacaledonica]
MRYDVFVSYSHRDKAFAEKLEGTLKHYRSPLRSNLQRRLSVFRDEAEANGICLTEELSRALASSRKLIVICSPAARESAYVNEEIAAFVATRGASNVIPVLAAGMPNDGALRCGKTSEAAFPPALIDALDDTPWAPDFRDFDQKGTRIPKMWPAWFHLLAAIYEVARERIEQTERRRRVRRSLGTVAVMFVVAIAVAAQMRSASKREAEGFASLARRAFDSGNCALGIRYALSGLPPLGSTPLTYHSDEVEALFRNGVATCPDLGRIKATVSAAIVLPGAGRALGNFGDGHEPFAIVDLKDQKLVKKLEEKMIVFRNSPKIGIVKKDNVLHVYSTDTGETVAKMDGVSEKRNAVPSLRISVSDDAKLVAVSMPGRKMRLLNVATSQVTTPIPSEDFVASAFSRDDKYLIGVTNNSRKFDIRDIRNGSLAFETESPPEVSGAVFSPSGNLVAMWGQTGAEFWRPGQEKSPIKFADMERGAPSSVQNKAVMEIVFDQSGKRVAIVGLFHVFIWDVERNKVLSDFKQFFVSNVQFLPDGVNIIGSAARTSPQVASFLGIWRIADGKRIAAIPSPSGGDINSVGVSADGSRAAVGTNDSIAQLWDLSWLQLPPDIESLQRHVCTKGYIGAQPYTASELIDPILRGNPAVVSPCERRGPFSLTYWSGLLSLAKSKSGRVEEAPAQR